MVEQPDYLSEFQSRIDSYQSYWRSLEFACMAVRVESEWIQFAGRVTLSMEPYAPNSVLKRIVDLDDFRAYAGRLEPKKIHSLISKIRESMVLSGAEEDTVRLVPSGSRGYRWQEPSVFGKRDRTDLGQQWPSVLRVYGRGDFPPSFLPQNFWRNIDTQLLQHNPPYNGFAALCAKLGLTFEQSSPGSYFELCAELPARFLALELNRKEKSLRVSIEYAGTPGLVIDWLPEHQTKSESVPSGDPEKVGQFEVTVPVPAGATGVEAKLLIMKEIVDQLSTRVDWENILLRICEFFDPGQAKLADFLFREVNLKNTNAFELGVARLLGLAGYSVLWFGKGAKDAMPDLVAYVRQPRGVERIIYGECTIKDPAGKFSDLAKRADDLRKHLGVEAGTILPVVFVRDETSNQDRRATMEHKLELCDGNDIRQLQTKITSDATAEEIFQFLRSLSGLTRIPGGVASPLEP